MTKEKYGKECKISIRPFTIFCWCLGARMRCKQTEVCQTCSRSKNVCQTCLLDLDYGLPIQVRDAALKIKNYSSHSKITKDLDHVQNIDNQISKIDATTPAEAIGKSTAGSDLLRKLASTIPFYKRTNSFLVKGECKRGECPYPHEKPMDPDDPVADENIRDRYYSANDPVADELMRRAAAMP